MKAVMTITSKELWGLLKEKYKDLDVEYIWLNLQETKEYFESKNNSVLLDTSTLRKKVIRIFSDGSFEESK